MKQHRHLLHRLTDSADLPGESFPLTPLVEIMGNKRVLIENHKGVCEYGTEQIRIKVSFGQVCVQGCGLMLSQMTAAQLVISGDIRCVSLTDKRG